MGDERELLVNIIGALSAHSQLEKLVLMAMNIGRNGCVALSTLLRETLMDLKTLNLNGNYIVMKGWMLWWGLLLIAG